ncbi:MAG: hypothetical protein SFU91_01615 [Chloroherpetonaceae bacterium]|nr:hypothetical protein [Chloroherpetonaceae bacterium]
MQKLKKYSEKAFFALLPIWLFVTSASISQFIAIPASDKVYVRWLSENEESVVRYELLRRNAESVSFQPVQTVFPRGSGQLYEVVDLEVAQVFQLVKNEPQVIQSQKRIIYQLRITMKNGTIEEREVSISFQTSSIRKTWGSIKALFR